MFDRLQLGNILVGEVCAQPTSNPSSWRLVWTLILMRTCYIYSANIQTFFGVFFVAQKPWQSLLICSEPSWSEALGSFVLCSWPRSVLAKTRRNGPALFNAFSFMFGIWLWPVLASRACVLQTGPGSPQSWKVARRTPSRDLSHTARRWAQKTGHGPKRREWALDELTFAQDPPLFHIFILSS